MTPEDIKLLAGFNDRLKGTVEIGLTLTKDPRGEALRQLCDDLSHSVPRLKIKTERVEETAVPCIRLQNSLRYQAVPTGPELAPFLEALAWLDAGPPPLPEIVRRQLDALQAPASLEVFIAPRCPHCPEAVRRLLPLTAADPSVGLTVIDGELFAEAATDADIRSAPTVILDGQYRWTGAFTVEEIVEMAASRDPARLGASALIGLIEEGNAPRLAEMMQAAGSVFPAFIELLTHEKWPVRLGAMVAFEYLAEEAPALAAGVADPLWERFGKADDTTKGDILHIIAQTGRKEWIPRLQSIAGGSAGEELRSAAADALEHLSRQDKPEHSTSNIKRTTSKKVFYRF